MRVISLARPNEQRRVEMLLVKLAKLKPVAAKRSSIPNTKTAIRNAS
jgi:hypothetical protein